MTDDQKRQYIALIDVVNAELHARQREALATYTKPEQRLQLQAALLDASRAYQRQIGLRHDG